LLAGFALARLNRTPTPDISGAGGGVGTRARHAAARAFAHGSRTHGAGPSDMHTSRPECRPSCPSLARQSQYLKRLRIGAKQNKILCWFFLNEKKSNLTEFGTAFLFLFSSTYNKYHKFCTKYLVKRLI
jgi:hypothetical protein